MGRIRGAGWCYQGSISQPWCPASRARRAAPAAPLPVPPRALSVLSTGSRLVRADPPGAPSVLPSGCISLSSPSQSCWLLFSLPFPSSLLRCPPLALMPAVAAVSWSCCVPSGRPTPRVPGHFPGVWGSSHSVALTTGKKSVVPCPLAARSGARWLLWLGIAAASRASQGAALLRGAPCSWLCLGERQSCSGLQPALLP